MVLVPAPVPVLELVMVLVIVLVLVPVPVPAPALVLVAVLVLVPVLPLLGYLFRFATCRDREHRLPCYNRIMTIKSRSRFGWGPRSGIFFFQLASVAKVASS